MVAEEKGEGRIEKVTITKTVRMTCPEGELNLTFKSDPALSFFFFF